MKDEIKLSDTLYDHFYAIEETMKLYELKFSLKHDEDLMSHYNKLESFFKEQEEKLSKYTLINTKTLETYDYNFIYENDCESLKKQFDDSIFTCCFDFNECYILENLQCDYCKINRFLEYSEDNEDCIKAIKK